LATIILELQPCGKLDRTLQLSGCQIKIRTGKYGIDPIDLISNGQILVGVDGYREDNVQLWQTSDATLMHRLKADAGEVWSSAQIRNVALSWDNKTLAVQHESTFELWRLNDGILLTAFSVGKDVIQRIALAPDGTMLAIASGNYGQLHRTIDGTLALSLWSYSDDDLEHSGREITQLCFSPAGSVLASGTLSGTIELWDIETGTLLQTFASDSELMSLTFSPDGSLLAYGTIDGKIHLHQASTGVLVRTFEGHREPVKRLRFSPDGTLLASAGDEPMVYLWQVDQGILIKTKKIYTKETPTSLTFSPQGELIFSSTQHNSPIVRLWQVK
jgi:WD40 repeat protein